MEVGAEMMIWCDGGPSMLRRETFPPRVEIIERDGVYLLHDDGASAVLVSSRATARLVR